MFVRGSAGAAVHTPGSALPAVSARLQSSASVTCSQLPFIRTVISLRKGEVKIESRWSIHDGPSTAYDAKVSACLQGLQLSLGAELNRGICGGRTQHLSQNPSAEVQLGFPGARTKDQRVLSRQPCLRSHCSRPPLLASFSLQSSVPCFPHLWPIRMAPNSP